MDAVGKGLIKTEDAVGLDEQPVEDTLTVKVPLKVPETFVGTLTTLNVPLKVARLFVANVGLTS